MTDTTVAYHVEDGEGRPAINVKLHVPGLAFWPEVFRAMDGNPDYEGRDFGEIDIAYERVQSDFWQAAQEIATQNGLGEIAQEGRSGGWLVFTDGRDPQSGGFWHEDAQHGDGDGYKGEPADDCSVCREDVAAWLVGYRTMVAWADAWIADAPRRVRDLAQQLAMDEAGEAAARRMFARITEGGLPTVSTCVECGAPLTVEGADGDEPQHVFCDICGKAEHPADLTPDWNGETGNHLSCERVRARMAHVDGICNHDGAEDASDCAKADG